MSSSPDKTSSSGYLPPSEPESSLVSLVGLDKFKTGLSVRSSIQRNKLELSINSQTIHINKMCSYIVKNETIKTISSFFVCVTYISK